MKEYISSYNGENDYKILVDDKNKMCNIYTNDKYNRLILKVKYIKIFLGDDEYDDFDDNYEDNVIGGTILLLINKTNDDKCEYILINRNITKFNAPLILTYTSPTGNNDVPYPYARDIKNNMYLFEDPIICLNKKICGIIIREKLDPYEYYYNHITPLIKDKNMKKCWSIDKNGVKHGIKLSNIKLTDTDVVYIQKFNNEIIKMTSNEFKKMIKSHDKQMGVTKIKYKVIDDPHMD